jgi:phenylacetate-CoA ligase
MNRALFRHVLLPAFETCLKRRKTLRLWSDLERTQWFGRAQTETLQLASLRRLIEHAGSQCPYYREQWATLGLRAQMLTSLADLSRWPITDRSVIRAHRERMQTPGAILIAKATGGSSGEPLQFDIDHASYEHRSAAWHRGYGWAGAAPGTKQLYLWGIPLGKRSPSARAKDWLYNSLHRRRIVPCFEGDALLAERFAHEIETYKPDAIVAYTSPIYEVARHLEREQRTLAFAPRSIVVGAEKLHPFQREVIERVFKAPVFETYGSREFMLIASECEQHRGLHVSAENLIVEVVDDEGQPAAPGVEGNVVVTDLHNFGMPFVRYANGDRAIASDRTCECGRGLPMLEKVVGRQLDMLHASGGRLIPGEFFPHLVKDFSAVRRFQVVQEEPHLVRFLLEAKEMQDEDRATLERLVREAFGAEVLVRFEPADRIELTPASKLRVVVNNIHLKRAG